MTDLQLSRVIVAAAIALLVLLLCIRAAWKLRRRRQSMDRLRQQIRPFQAVSVEPQFDSCGSAWKLRKRRFLSAEAPPLPLPWCDAKKCTCRYEHFPDRRDGTDRRSEFSHIDDNLSESGVYRDRERSDRRRQRVPGSARTH